MADSNYTYNPANIGEFGIDRMRFELGDTLVADGAESAYLDDREIDIIIKSCASWAKAKLELAIGVYRKLSYEVSTKVGPVSFELQQRVEHWRNIVSDLQQDASCGADISGAAGAIASAYSMPPYYHAGMQQNGNAGGTCP